MIYNESSCDYRLLYPAGEDGGNQDECIDEELDCSIPFPWLFAAFFFFLYGIPLALAWHSLTSRR